MRKVLIPTKLDKAAAQLLTERGYEVVLDGATPLAEQVKNHPDAEVLIVRSEVVDAAIIDALPKLRLIVRAGAGFNTIDIKYARHHNVDVMNTPGANSNAVAEEVVALLLAQLRFVLPADASTREGKWEKSKFLGHELTGKTVGILGLGHIGQLLVKRLSGFEVKVLGYDPMMSPDLANKLNIELTTPEEIFKRSDVVSLHIPENNETRGMINKSLIGCMKDGAVLINCARAGIISETDLREVKQTKKIFYCNDVYAKDAAGPKSVADVADIMMPHLGANTFEANFLAAKRAAEQTIAYFEHGITNCVVNKALPDGLNPNYQKLAYVLTKLANAYLGNQGKPRRVELTVYGELGRFSQWMTPPIVAGIAADFHVEDGPRDAANFLKESGIELVNREADNNKGYGDAMSIDLLVGDDNIRKAGARGVIIENSLMISRLNDFDKLYLAPEGHHLFVEYTDAPGVIGNIAGILGKHGINILDIRAPQDLRSGRSITVVKTNVEVSENVVEEIRQQVKAFAAFGFTYMP